MLHSLFVDFSLSLILSAHDPLSLPAPNPALLAVCLFLFIKCIADMVITQAKRNDRILKAWPREQLLLMAARVRTFQQKLSDLTIWQVPS